MPVENQENIEKRSVFLIGGYEPKSSDAFFKRTARELGRFAQCWDVEAQMATQTLSDDGLVATARATADTQGKSVKTDINFFVWNDIVLSDFSRPTVVRVAKYIATFVDYVATGTFFKIIAQAWRFSLYFLYPAIALTIISLIAVGLGVAVNQLSSEGLGPTASTVVGCALGAAAWFGLLRLSGRRWFVMHLMDLWSFSRCYLRDARPDARKNINRYADAVVQQAQLGDDDEIILVGHSTGGALILDIAATAIEKWPRLGADGPRVTILTVGSTALKIGLHPAASTFRSKVQRIVDTPAVQWVECQSMTDIINFYRTDPVAAMQLESARTEAFPQVHLIRVKDMLQPEIYKRIRRNFFRVHYQFIMANTKQYAYDFFVMCCSPKPFVDSLGTSLRYGSSPEADKTEPAQEITQPSQQQRAA